MERVLHIAGSNIAPGQFRELQVNMRVEAHAVHLGVGLCRQGYQNRRRTIRTDISTH